MTDLFDRLLILRSPGVGPVAYEKLIKQFGSPGAAAATLRGDTDLVDAVNREIDSVAQLGACFICDDSPEYPVSLRNIKGHPPVICARGNIETLSNPIVGIVGTRYSTATGIKFISNLAETFAEHNIAVASGMAIGTDTAAHSGALRVPGNTQTIAVLGGGVDYIWPTENESLYYEIIERGVVISEMPIGFVPRATNFVQRNRWIAGVSSKLILGEADIKSGSMRTANFALDFGRELWAVPSHPADTRAAGPNSLIACGAAKLCSGPMDFFTDDGKGAKIRQDTGKSADDDNELLNALGSVPVPESVLAQVVKKSITEIKRELVVLELRGLVQKQNGGYIKL